MLIIIHLFYYAWDTWFPWFRYILIFEFKHNIGGGLFIIPLLYAFIFVYWRGLLIVGLNVLIVIIALPLTIGAHVWPYLSKMSVSLTIFIVIIIIGSIIIFQHTYMELEAEREVERQSYLARLSRAQEDERKRIAQELHDGIIQVLTVMTKRVQYLIEADTTPMIKKDMEWMRDRNLELINDIRRLSYNLRPSVLDNLGLVPAIRWLIKDIAKHSNIEFRLEQEAEIPKYPIDLEINLFRIVQEALNNVIHHSKARSCVIKIGFMNEYLAIEIQDDGNGFRVDDIYSELPTSGKLGLLGMQQRAKFIGGELTINSEPNKGTTILMQMRDSKST